MDSFFLTSYLKTMITQILLFISLFLTPDNLNNSELKSSFKIGDPGITSISAMAFGPENILFIGDSHSADVKAIDLSNHSPSEGESLSITNLDGLIGEILGADVDQVQITDLAVNPANRNVYISVIHSSGTPVLMRVKGASLEVVPLNNVSHSKIALANAVAVDAKDRRGRPLRKWSISDIHYDNGKVMLSGLSNQEFASTFRAIPFPFKNSQEYSSLEIYHAAHGQYETHSPIKTFTTAKINGQDHVVASYTCTPLVIFPMSSFSDGKHSKGRTVAELGNRNTPLDIIEMESNGERVLLMANSSRPIMKIKISDIEAFDGTLTEPVEENSGTAGIPFLNFPLMNVQQLAKLSSSEFVMIQRTGNGDLILKSEGRRWL